jgi:hypothetical protein
MDTCVICLEPRGLVRTGCACRGPSAVVHVRCLVRAVVASRTQEAWIRCRVCTQEFTGAVSCALASHRAREPSAAPTEALYAAIHAVDALCEAQKPRRAEKKARALLAATAERFGPNGDAAALVTLRVAISLLLQGRHDEAARAALPALESAALRVQAMTVLARVMHAMRLFDEAERLLREVRATQTGGEALITGVLLCETLAARGSLAEQELEAVSADARRVFGDGHAVARKARDLRPFCLAR